MAGLLTVERQKIDDARGSFARLFCDEELQAAGWVEPIRQINLARTAHRGGVRGMHYQMPPASEMKLVTCIEGEVWDVAVDLRRESPTFLAWHAEHLSASNATALLIPEGFAHGFQVLSDGATLLYCHSAQWAPDLEQGLNPCDPRVAIAWPMPPSDLSARDAERSFLSKDYTGVEV